MSPVLRRWFLSDGPDVLELLREQARITARSMDDFARWTETGSETAAQAVRDGEHAGDDARRDLMHALRDVMSSPLEQEDVYVISDRLDSVQDVAKNLVRAADLASWRPDEHAARMGAFAREAAARLVDAIGALTDSGDAAGAAADAATKAARGVEHEQRSAIAALGRASDPPARLVVVADMYRRFGSLAEAFVGVSHRVWFSVLKEG